MPYVVAAYAIVLGTLCAYGLWLHAQRAALVRREQERAAAAARSGT